MNNQYTPGPWKTEQRTTRGEFVTETHIVSSDGSHIAEVRPKQIDANARLIAAAPELLRELKRLLEYYRHGELRPEALGKLMAAAKVIEDAEGRE